MKRKIAVHIQSEVQFFSLQPLLMALRERGDEPVIVCDEFKGNEQGYAEMVAGVKKLLLENGFKIRPVTDFKEEIFDVYLTPYMDGVIQAKCYLKFEYGTLNVKPSLTYIPEVLEKFHGFLCQSAVTYELLKAYGATFKVENLRFWGKKRKKVGGDDVGGEAKKRLLFAPSYNDQHEEAELANAVRILKKHYYVVVKGHHGTTYLKENVAKKDALMAEADEYYGSETSLSDLIMGADVCLFDNSSAIGEALYAGVPCAVMAKDLDYFRMGEMHTTQYYLVEDGILPYAKKVEDVEKIVDAALTREYIDKQKKCAQELFPDDFKTGVDGYLKVIDEFLDNRLMKEYCMLHDYIIQEKYDKIMELDGEVKKARKETARLAEVLEDNQKKKLYKIADKIYKMEGKIFNGKS